MVDRKRHHIHSILPVRDSLARQAVIWYELWVFLCKPMILIVSATNQEKSPIEADLTKCSHSVVTSTGFRPIPIMFDRLNVPLTVYTLRTVILWFAKYR